MLDFNAALAQACQPAGALGQFSNVTCLSTYQLFEGMGTSHVFRETTQAEFYAILYQPIPSRARAYFDTFWRDTNNSGLVIGDGLHLNTMGKSVLVGALIQAFERLVPGW